MPTLRCKNSLFIHVPKTAGSAVSRKLAGLDVGVYNYVPEAHPYYSELRPEDKSVPAWAVIRNPVDWLNSYFFYKTNLKWMRTSKKPRKPPIAVIDACATGEINSFIKAIYSCKQSPVSDYISEFIRDDTILAAHENVDEHFIMIMKRLEGIDTKGLPKVNVTNNRGSMSPEMANLVWRNEKEYFSRWYKDDGGLRASFGQDLITKLDQIKA